ncbi:MAG: hypothetical protein HY647_03220, partial [Acidobacteria bacterium]|nr:hypothetical protein [Acidobacteriota bacterium]
MRLPGLEPKHFVILLALACGVTAVAGVLTYYGRLPGILSFGSSKGTSQDGTTMAADTASQDARASELEMLRTHLRTKPDHTPILFRMAQISREMGKLSDAETHLREILRLEPDNHDARLEL